MEQPGEPDPFCERIRIRGFPTQEYLGLIFAYLGEGEPPSLPRYPDFEGPGLREVLTYTRHCNYFNSIDNDGIHVYFVHRSPGRDWRNWNGKIPQSTPIETEYGFGSVGTRRGSEGTARGMPNISFRIATDQYTTLHDAPRMDHLAWRVPVDDETHTSFNVALVHAYTDEEVRRYHEWQAEFQALGVSEETEVGLIAQTLRGELDYDSVDLPTEALITYQDHVTQQGQGAIPDHENEHLGRTDASVILRRKAQSRELRALAEGRPLKQWFPPSRAAGVTRGEEQQSDASVAP
ncbi:MAG: pobA 2 [Chloroflexi bacterium]|nr:pobA 2 [Chloroflexota bacterium]